MTDNPSPPASGPRVHIRSFGCQMNVHDAQKMADLLAASGYREVDAPEAADLVILNTCHIREKATEKVFSELGRLRALRDERGGELMVAVAGCVAQAEGAEIQRRAPVADIVVGPQSYHRLPALIAEAKTGRRVIDTEFPAEDKFDHLPAPNRMATARRGVSSFLTVQEGCDKFCSFCVVPYTRGAEVSRPVAKILAEAAQLVASGVRELTLIGQNVNAYHGADEAGRPADLVTLFERLSDLPGLARLRYATSHPRDMSDRLMAAHRDLPKLMPYLHLPVQSGSDRILGAMNRKHTAQDYREMIAQQRRLRPDIAVSSDFIVGFPGESDADFEATLRLVSEIGFAAAYSFKYSPRPGTPAAEAADQVPEAVMAERLARLQALLNAQQGAFNAGTLGRVLPVLFEKSGRHPGQLVGKSPYLQAVHVDAPAELIGAVVDVHITGMTTNGLLGAVASESPMEGRGPAAPAEDAA